MRFSDCFAICKAAYELTYIYKRTVVTFNSNEVLLPSLCINQLHEIFKAIFLFAAAPQYLRPTKYTKAK
jgi:hypothetical protein